MRALARAARAAVVLVLAVSAMTACGLPGSSDVQPGRKVGDNVAPRARVVVVPPAKGGSQDTIARGFISAGAGFQETDDNQQVVGRSYLAPTSLDRWRPTSFVTVFDTRTIMSIEHLPADQIRLTVAAVATIDETGHYRELPPGTLTSVEFTMVKIDGEWRVQLPDNGFGLWINTDDFSRVFGAYRIHYALPSERRLVADVRWFPSGPRVVTALARAQLGTVPAYLKGVATSGVPESARLAVDAVSLDENGVATVTLTNSIQTIDPNRRRTMWAQFVATLTQVPGVSSVSLEVQSVGKIPVPNLPPMISSLSDLGYDSERAQPATVGLKRTKDGVVRISPQSLDEGNQPRPPAKTATGSPGADDPIPVNAAYVDLAVSPDGSDIAAVARSRAELARWHGRQIVPVAPFGSDLTNPAYDGSGRLWIAGVAQDRGRIWTFDIAAAQAPPPSVVTAGWLEGRRVINLAPSPDGTRAAVLSKLPNDTDYRLDVAGIIRGSKGEPTSLAAPYRQGEPLTHFTDLTWLDSMTLAVLARARPADPLRPYQVEIGQGVGLRRSGSLDLNTTLIRPVPGARSITSTGGVRGLIVMTDTAAQVRAGSAWGPVADASEIVIAGR